MPILGSNGRGAPNGWQWAYDAFLRLRKLGAAAHEPVDRWMLSFPSRMENLKGQQWRLLYTERGKEYDIYIGWDAKSVAENIDRIVPTMKQLVQRRNQELTTERIIHQQLVEEGKITDPIFDPTFAARLVRTWYEKTKTIRTVEDFERFKRANKNLMALVNKRAGILDMSMLRYMTRHPDRKIWPNPPQTHEEWFRRHPELKPKSPRKGSNA